MDSCYLAYGMFFLCRLTILCVSGGCKLALEVVEGKQPSRRAGARFLGDGEELFTSSTLVLDWVLAWGLPRGGLRIMKQGVLKVYPVSSPQALIYKLQIVKL